jgi:hypothetical protein
LDIQEIAVMLALPQNHLPRISYSSKYNISFEGEERLKNKKKEKK